MKKFFSRLTKGWLQWRHDIPTDLSRIRDEVVEKAEKIHLIAGHTHVIEMEAYGETRPRHTSMPPTTVTMTESSSSSAETGSCN